jgi:hypothetical protein
MDTLTNDINSRNIQNIRYQIGNKKNSEPYYSTSKTNRNVITDYDHFPYTRYFRGRAQSSFPIVAEREAGWRPINKECYDSKYTRDEIQVKHNSITPRNYFQPACSTVYPKYVNDDDLLSLTDIKLNENCVISYR